MAERSRSPGGRQNYLINPRFQLQVILWGVLGAFLIIAILYAADQYFFFRFLRTGRELGLSEGHAYFQFLNEQRSFMNRVFLGASFLILAVMGGGGLLLSHRIAGPIHRLVRHCNRVADGKTTDDVRFRKKDFFPELADAYNRQLKALRDRRG